MKKKLLIGGMIILGIGACNALTGGNSIKDTEKSAKVKQIEETSKRLKREEAAAENKSGGKGEGRRSSTNREGKTRSS